MIPPEQSTSAQDDDAVGRSQCHPPWLVTCWRLCALPFPSVQGVVRNTGFLFPLVCAAWGTVPTPCCFLSLWQQHPYPGVPQSFCEETGLHESKEDRSLEKSECHLGVSALLTAASSWTLKGGRPSLASENVPCSYILLAALRLCFSYLLEPFLYQMQARTFPKPAPMAWLCPCGQKEQI